MRNVFFRRRVQNGSFGRLARPGDVRRANRDACVVEHPSTLGTMPTTVPGKRFVDALRRTLNAPFGQLGVIFAASAAQRRPPAAKMARKGACVGRPLCTNTRQRSTVLTDTFILSQINLSPLPPCPPAENPAVQLREHPTPPPLLTRRPPTWLLVPLAVLPPPASPRRCPCTQGNTPPRCTASAPRASASGPRPSSSRRLLKK